MLEVLAIIVRSVTMDISLFWNHRLQSFQMICDANHSAEKTTAPCKTTSLPDRAGRQMALNTSSGKHFYSP